MKQICQSSAKTPVLLIIFNRPELTRRVIRALSAFQPETVLVAADGPRFAAEQARCQETRECVSGMDWDCQVHNNFSDVNLGCGIRVHTAVSWALEQYQDVIVLEDDCIPHPSFFRYCSSLLSHYRCDERVMHISGNNFRGELPAGEYSYYFSKYTHAWGWATWRRAWRHFDWHMSQWPLAKKIGLIECWCDDPVERAYWSSIFDEMHAGAPDIWDYQWNFACWSQGGLVVIPRVNLVSNIGVGVGATHTIEPGPFYDLPTAHIGPITHPPLVVRNHTADAETFDRNFGGAGVRKTASLKVRVQSRLRQVAYPLRKARDVARASWRKAGKHEV
jgi:hypothetical protein